MMNEIVKPKNVRDIPDRKHPWKIICVPKHGSEYIWSVYTNQKKAIGYATHLSNVKRQDTFRVEKHIFL
jgi:hypothetical protein